VQVWCSLAQITHKLYILCMMHRLLTNECALWSHSCSTTSIHSSGQYPPPVHDVPVRVVRHTLQSNELPSSQEHPLYCMTYRPAMEVPHQTYTVHTITSRMYTYCLVQCGIGHACSSTCVPWLGLVTIVLPGPDNQGLQPQSDHAPSGCFLLPNNASCMTRKCMSGDALAPCSWMYGWH
jgi:hypothetical protein